MKYVVDANSVGRTLRNIRMARGLTQRDVCDRIGWSSTSLLSEYETGARDMTYLAMKKILSAYGLDVEISIIKNGRQDGKESE